MEETEQANREQHIAILKDDLKNSNLLSPRRTLQSVSSQFHIRSQSQTEKNIQYFRLKGYDLMAKLLEEESITHHINYSTLLCRNGYHVFALRKLLIQLFYSFYYRVFLNSEVSKQKLELEPKALRRIIMLAFQFMRISVRFSPTSNTHPTSNQFMYHNLKSKIKWLKNQTNSVYIFLLFSFQLVAYQHAVQSSLTTT